MGRPLSVLLVETQPGPSTGSMARYARLVENALRKPGKECPAVQIESLRLGLKSRALSQLPSAMITWLNHLWLQLTCRRRVRESAANVVHILDGSYAYLLHGLNGKKLVTTVHDVIPLLQQRGRFGNFRVSWPARWLIERSISGLREGTAVIAVSGQTARDLTEVVGLLPGKIAISSPALDPGLTGTVDAGAREPSKEGKPAPPYILHVGNNALYKNRPGVLRIYKHVRAEHDVDLVMAGPPPSWELVKFVKVHQLEGRVQFVIDPEDSELAELYRGASLLLFPSLYEGFGWPPLEAMACGCPVVCSSNGSLEESAGKAALMRPATDEDGLAKLCIAILSDPNLARSLHEKGREWVRQFSLERMRDDLLCVYRTVLAEEGQTEPEEAQQSA